MAGNIFVANTTAEKLLPSSSGHILVQIFPPSSVTVKIKEWGVFFDGVSVTAEPVLVQLAFTVSSFGDWNTHVPTKRSGHMALSQCLIRTLNDGSSEYTTDSSGRVAMREVHPQSGYQEKFAFGDEPVVHNKILSLMVQSPSSVNVIGEITYEE